MPDDRFKQALKDQLKLIELSCSNYDSGHPEAGLSISVNLRILLHDTQNSRSMSLLASLQNRDVSLCNTFPLDMDKKYTLYYASDTLTINGPLKDLHQRTCLDFQPANQWWNQVVLISGGHKYSRRDVVLTTADKDGGAHVDPRIPLEHEQLVKGVWTFVKGLGTEHEVRTDMQNEHWWLIRIFGHELLHSPDLLALRI